MQPSFLEIEGTYFNQKSPPPAIHQHWLRPVRSARQRCSPKAGGSKY
jgi:hypothetical protein